MLYNLLQLLESKGLLPDSIQKNRILIGAYVYNSSNHATIYHDIRIEEAELFVTLKLLQDPKIKQLLGDDYVMPGLNSDARRLRHDLADGRPCEEVIKEMIEILNSKKNNMDTASIIILSIVIPGLVIIIMAKSNELEERTEKLNKKIKELEQVIKQSEYDEFF